MSTRKYPDDFINKIICGDCLEVMKEMPKNCIDAIVTDPPYGLEFMGKEWDKLRNTWQAEKGRYHNDTTFIAKGDRVRYQAGLEMQLWHTQWLTEAYRVLKPGGSMLVMGGTRTSHRLACAIEDSAFIIKDTLMWIYGSGFPKAQDLGKMIDKRMGKKREVVDVKKHSDNFDNAKANKVGYLADPANKNNEKCFGYGKEDITIPSTDLAKYWDGFKVGGIKPAYEPIIWAVKPPEGSYVDNVLKWGVGAVNVDETRIGVNDNDHKGKGGGGVHEHWIGKDMENRIYGKIKRTDVDHNKGRFPANVILDEEAGEMLDEQSGNLSSGKPAGIKAGGQLNCYGIFAGGIPVTGIGDSGGASRFFYCAKASKSERGENNKHPTVKPIALFMWLIQLVTREEQLILDPFIGSGTTMLASQRCNRRCIGIEKEEKYCKIAEERLAQGVL